MSSSCVKLCFPLPRAVAAFAGFVLAVVAALPAQALAQNYPNRPIQLIIGAAPGGPSDVLARAIAEPLAKELGQPVVIDNKPGANGAIAGEAAKRGTPDGHVLHLSWIGNATAKSLTPKATFDVNRDLVHISQLVYGANILVVHPSTGFKTLADLIAHAKANPGKLNYASSGNGTSGHLAMEMLKQRAGIDMVHVPYKGGAQAVNDVLAGQVPLMFINQDAALAQMRAGKLQGLGITSPTRNAVAPDLPTIAELGFAGFESTAWAGLSAPVGTPRAVIDRLHAATLVAVQGAFRAKQEAVGAVVVTSTPAQFTAHIQKETDNWAQVIRAAGIQTD